MSEFQEEEEEEEGEEGEEDKENGKRRISSGEHSHVILSRLRREIPELESIVCKEIAKFESGRHSIGYGFFGFVVEAKYRNIRLAIKVISGNERESEKQRKVRVASFEKELAIARIASEKGFGPRVFGGQVCEEKGMHFSFIVMELCESVPEELNTLDSWNERLPVIMKMHEAGVFHNDLHGDNWLLRKGEFLICDFGFSELFTRDISETDMAALDEAMTVNFLSKNKYAKYDQFLRNDRFDGFGRYLDPRFAEPSDASDKGKDRKKRERKKDIGIKIPSSFLK